MIITYFGDQCFRIENGPTGILIDPTSNRLKADIVVRTVADPEHASEDQTDISYAGEYEVGGIEIQGWQLKEESSPKELKTAYAITWEGVRLLILGGLKGSLPAEAIDQMGEIDVLFLPVGGDGLSIETAVSLMKKIDPNIVIPYGGKAVGDFIKKIGQSPEVQDKWVFKKKDLLEADQKAIILTAQ